MDVNGQNWTHGMEGWKNKPPRPEDVTAEAFLDHLAASILHAARMFDLECGRNSTPSKFAPLFLGHRCPDGGSVFDDVGRLPSTSGPFPAKVQLNPIIQAGGYVRYIGHCKTCKESFELKVDEVAAARNHRSVQAELDEPLNVAVVRPRRKGK